MLGVTTARVGLVAAILGLCASFWCLATVWSTPAGIDTSRVTALSALTQRIDRDRAELGQLRAGVDEAVIQLRQGDDARVREAIRSELLPRLAKVRGDIVSSQTTLGAVSSRSGNLAGSSSPLDEELGIDPAITLDAQLSQLSGLIEETAARASVLDGAATTVTTDTTLGFARSAVGSLGGRALTTALGILAATISGALGVVALTESPNRGAFRARLRRLLSLDWTHEVHPGARVRSVGDGLRTAGSTAGSGALTAWDASTRAVTTASAGARRLARDLSDRDLVGHTESVADALVLRVDALTRTARGADIPDWIVRVLAAARSWAGSLPNQLRESLVSARAWVSEFSLRSE